MQPEIGTLKMECRYVCRSDSILDITSNNRSSPEHEAFRSNVFRYSRAKFGYSLDRERKKEREREREREANTGYIKASERVDRNFWQTCRKLIQDFHDKKREQCTIFCSCTAGYTTKYYLVTLQSFFFFILSPVVIVAIINP